MSAPTELFLEKNQIDNKFKVIDKDGFCFGDGEMPDHAIKHARVVAPELPIYFGSGIAVPNNDNVLNTYECIMELANLAGMKVMQAYDDDMRLIGWTMELIE